MDLKVNNVIKLGNYWFTNNEYKNILIAREYVRDLHDNKTNQKYCEKSNKMYSYHLNMTFEFGLMFLHLVPQKLYTIFLISCYLHDSVEDARVTYNDIVKFFISKGFKDCDARLIAQISCNLCSDIFGINRDSRNSQAYYDRINSSKISVYVKLCDRMANVTEGILNNNISKAYIKEMELFLEKLYIKKNSTTFEHDNLSYLDFTEMKNHLLYIVK